MDLEEIYILAAISFDIPSCQVAAKMSLSLKFHFTNEYIRRNFWKERNSKNCFSSFLIRKHFKLTLTFIVSHKLKERIMCKFCLKCVSGGIL